MIIAYYKKSYHLQIMDFEYIMSILFVKPLEDNLQMAG